MSNIQQARESLDAKLAAMGYVQPENNSGGGGTYKVYDEKAKDAYVSSQNHGSYATFGNEVDTEVQKTDSCPACDEKAVYSCHCEIGELMCANNHMWYVKKNGEVVLGDPHEDED